MRGERVAKDRFLYTRLLGVVVVTIGLLLATTSVSLAHKVYLYAWVEGDTVYTESYFGSKKKVQGGLIQVFNLSGEKLLEGHTDEKGEFSFKVPQKTDLRIVVEASMGHKNEYVLKADELWDSVPAPTEKPETHQDKAKPGKQVEAEQLQTVVEKALDSRLKPIIRELAKIRREKGPGLTEIIGGIGYIFGLMGVVLYFWSRKNR